LVLINNTAEFFCAGPGYAHFGKIRVHGYFMPILSSAANNDVADFNFTSNPLKTGNWTTTGGGVSYTTASRPTGASGALQLVGPADQRASYKIACKPQDIPVAQFWLRTADQVAAGGVFDLHVLYLDGAGNPLPSYATAYTDRAEHPTFTFEQASGQGAPAPPGTQFCAFVFEESGSGKSPTAIVGRPWFGLQFAPVAFAIGRRRRRYRDTGRQRA
jgi:hypothetical protein